MLFNAAQVLIAALPWLDTRHRREAGSFQRFDQRRLIINEFVPPAMKGLIDDLRRIVRARARAKTVP